MPSIFDRQTLPTPSVLHTVAQRRFDDAHALCRTGQNARANGALYLLGISLEIVLKAKMLGRYRSILSGPRPAAADDQSRVIYDLFWRSHDLPAMVVHLRDLVIALEKKDELLKTDHARTLRQVASQWTIYARYSSRQAALAEAERMLDQVRVLKEILR
ncbi:MAG: hypothetical protein QM770_13815 [Tepidisphaeraceae bacterium]